LREGLKAYFKEFPLPGDAKIGGLDDLKSYYGALSRQYGYEVEVPEREMINVGVRLRREGKAGEARLLYEYAARQYPGEVNSYFQLADLHREEGSYDQAIKYYEEFLARRAEPVIEQRLLALRRYVAESAAHAVEEAIKSAGSDAGMARYRELRAEEPSGFTFDENEFNAIGYSFLARGNLDAAVAVFRMNVEMNPESANAYDSLAEGCMARGDMGDAVRFYRRSLELDPANANAREKLAELEKTGEPGEKRP
jgi:tetratricopeptide (TPR) repeat protein